MTTETVTHDFRLQPPCEWDLDSSVHYVVQIGI